MADGVAVASPFSSRWVSGTYYPLFSRISAVGERLPGRDTKAWIVAGSTHVEGRVVRFPQLRALTGRAGCAPGCWRDVVKAERKPGELTAQVEFQVLLCVSLFGVQAGDGRS
jgi:hypothetical protein